jgi:hypothetical protein
VVVQIARNISKLVIPKPGLSARNLLFVASGTADSLRDGAAFRNDKSFDFDRTIPISFFPGFT